MPEGYGYVEKGCEDERRPESCGQTQCQGKDAKKDDGSAQDLGAASDQPVSCVARGDVCDAPQDVAEGGQDTYLGVGERESGLDLREQHKVGCIEEVFQAVPRHRYNQQSAALTGGQLFVSRRGGPSILHSCRFRGPPP